jgi:hypothetical protein
LFQVWKDVNLDEVELRKFSHVQVQLDQKAFAVFDLAQGTVLLRVLFDPSLSQSRSAAWLSLRFSVMKCASPELTQQLNELYTNCRGAAKSLLKIVSLTS